MRKFIIVISIGSLCAGMTQAQLTVSDTVPAHGTVGAPVDTDVVIEFNAAINPASVDATTFTVRGQQFGVYPGTYRIPANNVVAFDPAVNFLFGEEVEVTLSHDLISAGSVPLTPYNFSFVVEAQACPLYQFVDSGQLLTSLVSWAVEPGDLDGDGDLDLFFGNIASFPNGIWLNDGLGNYSDSGQALGGSDSLGANIGDVDGDGDLDAFVANDDDPNRVWINDGLGIFSDSGQSLGATDSLGVDLGDVDGDGDLDAFVANKAVQPNRVWVNNGLGIFSDSGQLLGATRSRDIVFGDVDGDGDLDAFVVSGNAFAPFNQVWANDGIGIFSEIGPVLGTLECVDVELGDFDGDGDLDAFGANRGGQPDVVWMNDGLGIFTNSGQSLGRFWSSEVDIGDLDGDGDLDAFTASNWSRTNQIWENDGSGVFSEGGHVLAASDSSRSGLGDMDGDGDLDLYLTNLNLNDSIWKNDCLRFRVAGTIPANGEISVAANALIQVTFRNPLNPGTVDPATFTVRGRQFGVYPGIYSFPPPT